MAALPPPPAAVAVAADKELDEDEERKVRFYIARPFPLHNPLSVKMLVKILQKWGWRCDPRAKDEEGLTAVMYHVRWGEEAVVLRLLDEPKVVASLNTTVDRVGPWQGFTALHHACLVPRKEPLERARIIHKMLEAGIDMAITDKEGGTALEVLLRHGSADDPALDALLLQMLKEEVPIPLNVYKGYPFPLHRPMTVATLEVILTEWSEWERGDIAAKDLRDLTCLMQHCRWGHEAVVQRLLEEPSVRASLDAVVELPGPWQGYTALHHAALGEHPQEGKNIVEMLLCAAVDARIPLQVLLKGCPDDQAVDVLLDRILSMEVPIPLELFSNHPFPLHRPMAMETLDVLLTEVGRNLAEMDPRGCTPLMQHARWGNDSVVRRLLQEPRVLASVDTAVEVPGPWRGYTALHFACSSSPPKPLARLSTIQHLLGAGADTSLYDMEGDLAVEILHRKHPGDARAANALRTGDLVLKVQAEFLTQPFPLHQRRLSLGCLNVLLNRGLVDPGHADEQGLTPLMFHCSSPFLPADPFAWHHFNGEEEAYRLVLRLLEDPRVQASVNATQSNAALETSHGWTAMHFLVSQKRERGWGRRRSKLTLDVVIAAMLDALASPAIKAHGVTPLDILYRERAVSETPANYRHNPAIVLLEAYFVKLERAAVLIKTRRLVMLQNALEGSGAGGRGEEGEVQPPAALTHGPLKARVERGEPLPHVALAAPVVDEVWETGKEERRSRRALAFLVGLERLAHGGQELPNGAFVCVMNMLLPRPEQTSE